MFATTLSRNVAAAAGAALISFACLTVAAGPATAATPAPAARTVSYADLNLGNARGRAVLNQRIKSAAQSVCQADSAEVAARTRESRCVKAAIARATAS